MRDRSLVGLYGRYIYRDLCQPQLRSAHVDPGGQEPACPAGGEGPIADPLADRAAPQVAVGTSGSASALTRGALRLTVRCDEPCRIEADGALARGRGGRGLAHLSRACLRAAGGETRAVALALGSSGRSLAKRGARFARVRVRVRVLDAARNAVVVQRDVRLRR